MVRSQLTLRQVAEFAEVFYRGDNVKEVSKNVQTRQIQIIEYQRFFVLQNVLFVYHLQNVGIQLSGFVGSEHS